MQFAIVRRDLQQTLEWPTGAIISQACHACVFAIWMAKDDPVVQEYVCDTMHKVIKEVRGEKELLALSNRLSKENILHKLWVEQPENIPTCLATVPARKSTLYPLFRKLKLYK